MVVSTDAVDVAMAEFFGGRSANINDFNVEVQSLAGEGMVSIDSDFGLGDFDDSNDFNAVICLRLELHADFEIFHAGELSAGHRLDHLRIFFTVTVFRTDSGFEFITLLFADELTLETRNDVAETDDKSEWLMANRRIDDIAFVVFNSVVHHNNGIVSYIHMFSPQTKGAKGTPYHSRKNPATL